VNVKRTSTALALTAAGAVLLLSLLVPAAPLSIKIVGFLLLVTGLARLRLPQQAVGWLRSRFDQAAVVLNPGAGEPEAPAASLDELLSAAPEDNPPAG
jgi:hypothetical protein